MHSNTHALIPYVNSCRAWGPASSLARSRAPSPVPCVPPRARAVATPPCGPAPARVRSPRVRSPKRPPPPACVPTPRFARREAAEAEKLAAALAKLAAAQALVDGAGRALGELVAGASGRVRAAVQREVERHQAAARTGESSSCI